MITSQILLLNPVAGWLHSLTQPLTAIIPITVFTPGKVGYILIQEKCCQLPSFEVKAIQHPRTRSILYIYSLIMK
jgi:hypothetical protein